MTPQFNQSKTNMCCSLKSSPASVRLMQDCVESGDWMFGVTSTLSAALFQMNSEKVIRFGQVSELK